MTDKPPYRVPSMEEIQALPWNGFNAVSTFSGCGGSSLGYRMAGFKMLYASEFVPAAQETYRANAAPYTVLDTRDVREVTGKDILDAIGLGVGEIDLFDGSPPCASFSTAGKRHKGWGEVKKYSDTQQRTDDLFLEYARLIEQTQPRTFVAENVSGLVKGTAKGYFKLILAELKACGYRVGARVLDASWLGVPQARQRLIFIGVREDLGMDPVYPSPLPYQYTVRDALLSGDGFGPRILHNPDGHPRYSRGDVTDRPAATIMTDPNHFQVRGEAEPVTHDPGTGQELRVIHDTSGQFSVGDVTDRPSPTITVGVNAVNSQHFRVHGGESITHDPETGQALSIVGRRMGDAWANTPQGGSSDRYFSLKRSHPDRPSQTITTVGLGNNVMHYAEPRRFTLGELRAIGGFPADFVLTGTYAQRWERIGRAVPPVMMSHIAATVRDRILVPLREAGTI